MKKFDAVLYMLPVPNGEFENVVNPNTHAIIHRNPKYDHKPVYAIVLDIHPQENEDPLIDVAFLHPSQAGALAGADWREAFERVFAVRHVDHDDVGENFAMGHYRELPDQEDMVQFVKDYNRAFEQKSAECISLNRLVLELEAKLSQPCKHDLDAAAAEQQAKEQTS